MSPHPLHNLDAELNPAQKTAVTHLAGPLLVFAGAGSGKTRVITFRAGYLIAERSVPPWGVMCVTFTNKAAGEMRQRIGTLLGADRARDVWVATFHATGARLLRAHHERVGLARDFVVYDESDSRAAMDRVFKDAGIDDEALAPRDALYAIDRWKQEALDPEAALQAARGPSQRLAAQLYADYERRLLASNAVDFGDLLLKTLRLLSENDDVADALRRRFRHVMVDEFQDTNAAQYAIVRRLIGPERNICVVGDDDQAIYHWRGADVRNILNFRDDFPNATVVKLEQNYRSTRNILRAANAVISRADRREPKELYTQGEVGARVEWIRVDNERHEAAVIADRVVRAVRRGIRPTEIAVFYRINAQSRVLEEAMREQNVPYAVYGGQRFYDRAEIKDAHAYLRLVTFPHDDVALDRVINVPARGIGKTTLDRLFEHAKVRGSSLWSLLEREDLPSSVQGAAKKKLLAFRDLIGSLQLEARAMAHRPSALASHLLEASGYLKALEQDPSDVARARAENLEELIGAMQEYERTANDPSLTDYLERVTLSEAPAGEESPAERISLMTVHSAKGLEFDLVFVGGLEERVFPYKGVEPASSRDELEEERRLAYVAITRARRELVMTSARSRTLFGAVRTDGDSRFVNEIPREILSITDQRRAWESNFAAYSSGARNRWTDVESSEDELSNDESVRTVGDRSGEHVVYDEIPRFEGPSAAARFRPGMFVRHAHFGSGRIQAVEVGSEPRLIVLFSGSSRPRRVLADRVEIE